MSVYEEYGRQGETTIATATADISRASERLVTHDHSARRLWQELRLAESEAYWLRKARGKWPTEQNGKLHHDGPSNPSKPVAEFLQDLARKVGVICDRCNGAYPCACRTRRDSQEPSPSGSPAADEAGELPSLVEGVVSA